MVKRRWQHRKHIVRLDKLLLLGRGRWFSGLILTTLRVTDLEQSRMNASNILLTHFSARQPKIPHQIDGYPSSSSDASGLVHTFDAPFLVTAFDYANLTIGNMWKMQFYIAAIEQSYQEMLVEVGEEEEAEQEEKVKLAWASGQV